MHKAADAGIEHVGNHPVREQGVDRVPVQDETAVFLVHVQVHPDLGRLVEPPDEGSQLAHRLPEAVVHQARQHNRHHGAGGPSQPRELALNGHAVEAGVGEIVEKLRLHALDLVGEQAAAGKVGLEQEDRGEHSRHPVHLRVERETVEDRHVDREAPIRTPSGEHLGIDEQTDGRKRDPEPPRALPEAAGCRHIEARGSPREPRHAIPGGFRRHRQVRVAGECRESLRPVLPRPLESLGSIQALTGEHIVSEGELQRRQCRGGVAKESGELAEQDGHATTVDVEEIQRHVQAGGPGVQPIGAQVEQRPLVSAGQAAGHLAECRIELRRLRAGIQPLEVGHDDAVGRDLSQDALSAVVGHHSAEDVVALDQALPPSLQPIQIQVCAVDLQIAARGEIPELERVGPPQPVGALQLGERERIETPGGVGDDGGASGRLIDGRLLLP